MKTETFLELKTMIYNMDSARLSSSTPSLAVQIVVSRAEVENLETLQEIACLKQEKNILEMLVRELKDTIANDLNDCMDGSGI